MTKDIIERYKKEFDRNIPDELGMLKVNILNRLEEALASTQEERDRSWVEKIKREREILEKVLAKATMPNNIAIYEEKIETLDDLLSNTKTNEK